jgi:hypothetical protein
MIAHGTPRFSNGMLPLSGGLLPLPRQCCAVPRLVVGLCRRFSCGSTSSSAAPFHIAPLLLPSLDSCHHPLVTPQPLDMPSLLCAASLVSRRRPLPHPTLVAHPLPRFRHLSLLHGHIRHTLFRSCLTVVGPPPPSSRDNHRHPLLRCRIIAPPPPLDRC